MGFRNTNRRLPSRQIFMDPSNINRGRPKLVRFIKTRGGGGAWKGCNSMTVPSAVPFINSSGAPYKEGPIQ
jgi:hypothetical protein